MRGSWALVTGATGGLGGALARRLAQQGHALLLVGRRAERLRVLAEGLGQAHGVEVASVVIDLADEGAATQLLEQVAPRSLAVVALAASSYAHGPLAELSDAEHDALLQCNVVNTARLLRGLLEQLDARGQGRVLVVGSLGALMPAPQHAAYSASKAWLHQMVGSLQAERVGRPVSLTLACPGGMRTAMLIDSPAWSHLQANPLVRASVLSPEQAADQMLTALFRGRRLIVPGWINGATLWLSRLLPHWLGIHLSRAIYVPSDDGF